MKTKPWHSVVIIFAAATIVTAQPTDDGPETVESAATQPQATSGPTTRGATSQRASKPEDPTRKAVAALEKEASDALRKRQSFPRIAPTYFEEHPGERPTAEQTLAALKRKLHSDPRVDAYIKTQLLSAVPRFDEPLAKESIAAFVNAPKLVPLPGLTTQEQRRWDQRAMQAKEDGIEAVNADLAKEREPYEAVNAALVAYREEFAKRIGVPETMRPKLLQARVEDLSQRFAAGLDAGKDFTNLTGEIRGWATTARKPSIAEMQAFVKEYARRTGPTMYLELQWDAKNRKSEWIDREAAIDTRRLNKLIDDLEEAKKTALP